MLAVTFGGRLLGGHLFVSAGSIRGSTPGWRNTG